MLVEKKRTPDFPMLMPFVRNLEERIGWPRLYSNTAEHGAVLKM